MSATPLGTYTRYMPYGKRKFYWVTSIASKSAPTRSELNAGTDLSPQLVAGSVQGFQTKSSSVEAPDLDTRFTSKVAGRVTVDDSSLSIYLSADSADARTLLTRDSTGFIVIFPEGDIAGQKMNVFPATIMSSSVNEDTEAVAKLEVMFAITSEPAENVTVPT